MSKWTEGFPPSRNGNYLIKTELILAMTARTTSYVRADYNSLENRWTDRHGNSILHSMSGMNYKCYWWDEFKITENKTIRKLKF